MSKQALLNFKKNKLRIKINAKLCRAFYHFTTVGLIN